MVTYFYLSLCFVHAPYCTMALVLRGSFQYSLVHSEWWTAYRGVSSKFPDFVDRAVAGGFHADRMAWVFASGYQSALGHLLSRTCPRVNVEDHPCAFCATEGAPGAPPRSILTTATPSASDGAIVLRGSKSFVTHGALASRLLVVASMAGEGGNLSTNSDSTARKDIRVVMVDPTLPGVNVLPSNKTLPFIPEIDHSRVELKDVKVDQAMLLDGDGYTNYVKAFRTIEDTLVEAALIGYMVRLAALFDWPQEDVEELLALTSQPREILRRDPLDSETHLLYAGFHTNLGRTIARLVESPQWLSVDVEIRDAWERDQPIRLVAQRARDMRRELAWSKFPRSKL